MRSIVLVDHTKEYRPPPGALEALAKALTIQIERDFAPAWAITPVRVTVGGRGEKIHFFDSARDASEVGYHMLDPKGDPYAHVYAKPAFVHGSDWLTGPDALSVTASHEALEMLCDPTACDFSFNGARTLWAREVSDPVQESPYSIVARGRRVAVSDFVYPEFFNAWSEGPFDHLRLLETSFSLAKGGYAVCQRSTNARERSGRRFGVKFEKSTPQWQRRQKKHGFGRTYWRLLLHG